MDHELHSAAFVEEALGNDGVHAGHCAQNGPPGHNIFNGLFCARIIEAALPLEPLDGVENFGGFLVDEPLIYKTRHSVGSEIADGLPQLTDLLREFFGASWGLAQPEGNGGWRAVGIFHQDASGAFHAADAPAHVSQQDNSSREAFN